MSFEAMIKKGNTGEFLVEQLLKNLSERLPLRYVKNLLIQDRSRSNYMTYKTQIDFVVLTPKGLVTLEVKNWNSVIERLSDNTWRAILHDGACVPIKSPLNQSKYHAKVLVSNYDIDCYDKVVFIDKSCIVGDSSDLVDLPDLSEYLSGFFTGDPKYSNQDLKDLHFHMVYHGMCQSAH